MKKSFSYANRLHPRKQERGIAIIFTLGILGLLTVIALGFASTALLNNKLAQNVSGDSYAKSLALNLALPRAIAAISNAPAFEPKTKFDYSWIYSREPSAKNKGWQDHLDDLKTKIDGVPIYYFSKDGQPDNVTWEYIHEDNDTSKKIIGRYAYVVVPDKGRLNPSRNVGVAPHPFDNDTEPTTDDDKKIDHERPGKYITFNLDSSKKSDTLKTFVSGSDGNSWKALFSSFAEVKNTSTATDDAEYKKWFFKYDIGMHAPTKTRDDICIIKKDSTNHYYKKFSMEDSVTWDSVDVKTLIGEDVDIDSSDPKTITEASFMPFLKKMWNLATDDTQKARVRQLAANIIQYNRSADKETVSDVTTDWLTSSTTPTYIGIGRHPMINEVGIAVEVMPDLTAYPCLEADKTVDASANTTTYKYTPVYKIRITPGVELIDPFGISKNNTTLKSAEIQLKGTVEITLQGSNAATKDKEYIISDFKGDTINSGHFNKNNLITLPPVTFSIDGSTTGKDHIIEAESSNWKDGYSIFEKFWIKNAVENDQKGITVDSGNIHSFKIITNTLDGEPKKHDLFAGMKIHTVKISNLKVLLKYEGGQRDFVTLPDKTEIPSNYANVIRDNHLTNHADKPHVIFYSFQVKDPFVNLDGENEWEFRNFVAGATGTDLKTGEAFSDNAIKELSKLYSGHGSSISITAAGTLVDDSAKDVHKNSLTESKFNTPADLNDGTTVGLDPAYNGTTQLPFAFIRHAPMKHFWEFACIHTGARWSTLDLTKKVAKATPEFKDYFDSIPDVATAGMAYAPPVPAGEIFDQVTFVPIEKSYTEGLINLNTDSHIALHALFSHLKTGYRANLTKALENTPSSILYAGERKTDSDNFLLDCAYNATISSTNASTCLACAIGSCTQWYTFRQRSDLLIPAADFAQAPDYDNTKHGDVISKLQTLQNNVLKAAPNRIEKNQIVAKMMPYLRAAPVDMVYVIVLAQTIQDVEKNQVAMFDWDGKGYDADIDTDSKKARNKKLGLLLTSYISSTGEEKEDEETQETHTLAPSSDLDKITKGPLGAVEERKLPTSKIQTITTEAGVYDIGFDKITGEAKIVVALVREPDPTDPSKGTWRIARIYHDLKN